MGQLSNLSAAGAMGRCRCTGSRCWRRRSCAGRARRGRGRRRATTLTTMSRLSRRTRSSCRQPSSAIQSSNRSRSARGACAPHPTVSLTLPRARATSRATAPTDRRRDRPDVRRRGERRAAAIAVCAATTRSVASATSFAREGWVWRPRDAAIAEVTRRIASSTRRKRPSLSRSRPSHFPHAPATKAVLSITVSSS